MNNSAAQKMNDPAIAILGVPFDRVSMLETLGIIEEMVRARIPQYVVTANVDFVVQALHDVELRRILFDAHLVLCDGMPLVWASKMLGNPLPERVPGADLVPLLLERAENHKYRLFFLGGMPDVVKKAVGIIQGKYPGIPGIEYYSPPYNALLEMEHETILAKIKAAQPDILFVCFGCPKQEKWINMHYRTMGVPVSIGVGGTVDFLAGATIRAPIWMQKSGLEWLFRLLQEPKRLMKRYTKDFRIFGVAVVRQWMEMRRRKRQYKTEIPSSQRLAVSSSLLIKGFYRLDAEVVAQNKVFWDYCLSEAQPLLFDLNSVEFVDSTGVGLLVRLQKKRQADQRSFLIINPSSSVKRALDLMKLSTFFQMFPSVEEAQKNVSSATPERSSLVLVHDDKQGSIIEWQGELTAATVEQFSQYTAAQMKSMIVLNKEIVIDLKRLTYLDSSGVGFMVKLKKNAMRGGHEIRFQHPQDNVLNVLSLLKLTEYLLGTKL